MPFDPFAQFRMTDHVALVTGGAQNIGEAIALTFAAAGAEVRIPDLNGAKAMETAKRIADETGQQVLGIQCDVTGRIPDQGMRRNHRARARRPQHFGEQRGLG